MTLEQAIQACRAAGIANPTAQDLALEGFEPANWMDGWTPAPVAVTSDDLKASVAATLAAGTAANVPAEIISGIVSLGRMAMAFV